VISRTASLLALIVSFSVVVLAQGEEFARVLRNESQATLSVFGVRPADLAAKKLVDEFGAAINIEDPAYLRQDDVREVGVVHSELRFLVPKASSLEMRLNLRQDGSLLDTGQVVRDLVDTANVQLPFSYRILNDGDVFTLVPARTRDQQGRSIELTSILDRHVTVPLGSRTIFEHVNLLMQALQQQTGVRIGCCQSVANVSLWGRTVVSCEARDEVARTVLLRLLRLEPARARVVRDEHSGAYHLVESDPHRERWRWALRCEPWYAWCTVSVSEIPERP
jgi:hypothetical protein